jgi:hypothetical protein
MEKGYWYCPYCGVKVDPQDVTYHAEYHKDCGHPAQWVDKDHPTYNQLRAENKQLREGVKEYKDLLEWFLNLANGCSKSGGKATQHELEECIEQARQVFRGDKL